MKTRAHWIVVVCNARFWRRRSVYQRDCLWHGWTPEWHQDADGHKSGTKEKNRPGWLALKARLSDPDVVSVVANDLSRLHRKGWRVGDLIEYLDQQRCNACSCRSWP